MSSNAAATWTKVEPTWEMPRVRQEVGNLISEYKLAFWILIKERPELLADMQQSIYSHFTELMKQSGVKTPFDLVKYLAELTVNLVGGEVSITGNEEVASISYDQLPTWDKMKNRLDLSDEGRLQMMNLLNASMQRFADGFGFESGVEANLTRPIMTITFRTRKNATS